MSLLDILQNAIEVGRATAPRKTLMEALQGVDAPTEPIEEGEWATEHIPLEGVHDFKREAHGTYKVKHPKDKTFTYAVTYHEKSGKVQYLGGHQDRTGAREMVKQHHAFMTKGPLKAEDVDPDNEWDDDHDDEPQPDASKELEVDVDKLDEVEEAADGFLDISHPAYHEKHKPAKWNVPISPASGHDSAQGGKMLRQRLPGMTKEQHAAHAQHHTDLATAKKKEHSALIDTAHMERFGKKREITDPFVSGIGSQEYKPEHKERLSQLSHEINAHRAASAAHTHAAKHLFRRSSEGVEDDVAEDMGKGISAQAKSASEAAWRSTSPHEHSKAARLNFMAYRKLRHTNPEKANWHKDKMGRHNHALALIKKSFAEDIGEDFATIAGTQASRLSASARTGKEHHTAANAHLKAALHHMGMGNAEQAHFHSKAAERHLGHAKRLGEDTAKEELAMLSKLSEEELKQNHWDLTHKALNLTIGGAFTNTKQHHLSAYHAHADAALAHAAEGNKDWVAKHREHMNHHVTALHKLNEGLGEEVVQEDHWAMTDKANALTKTAKTRKEHSAAREAHVTARFAHAKVGNLKWAEQHKLQAARHDTTKNSMKEGVEQTAELLQELAAPTAPTPGRTSLPKFKPTLPKTGAVKKPKVAGGGTKIGGAKPQNAGDEHEPEIDEAKRLSPTE